MIPRNITTRNEAQDFAIEWQSWQADRALSYSELAEWADYFTELGERFDLTEEFTENGVI